VQADPAGEAADHGHRPEPSPTIAQIPSTPIATIAAGA
jgi:hypothetical protein